LRTIRSGGAARAYRLEVPANYDRSVAAPLVFNFHGYPANAAFQSAYSNLPKVGHERGLIVVTPDAVAQNWRVPSEAQGTADVMFVKDLVAEVEAAYCVDVNRVFAAGYSRGALMATVVGCELPDTFGAIALVALEYRPARCHPIPALAFHGTKDANVHYQAGPGVIGFGTGVKVADLPGTIDNMADWAELDRCRTNPTVEKLGSDVVHRTYPGCLGDADVELYTIVGGGHTWPGTNLDYSQLGVSTDTIDANDIMIRFFLDHPLRPS
jgi:polyhydroxybutyrate depolymerase